MIYQLTADDPPVFMLHYEGARTPGNSHHPNFEIPLKDDMDQLGIECIRRMDTEYPSKDDSYKDMAQFVVRHLGLK